MKYNLSKIFSSLLSEFSSKSNISGKRTLRLKVYELLHTVEIDSKTELVTKVFLAILIVLSIITVIIETVPSIEAEYGDQLWRFEVFAVICFSVEYILRVWSIVEAPEYQDPVRGRLRYCRSAFALIDLIAILPFFIPAMMWVDLRFVRGLRLLRLLRILKLGSYSSSLALIMRVIGNKKIDIIVSISILILLIIISGCLLFYLEHEAQPEKVSTIPVAIWWCVDKVTSLGYARITPITNWGKIFDAISSFLGLSFFAIPSGILVTGLLEEVGLMKKKPLCPHCGKQLS